MEPNGVTGNHGAGRRITQRDSLLTLLAETGVKTVADNVRLFL